MKKFRLEKAPSGATYIYHDLEPKLKIQVFQNRKIDYDIWVSIFDIFTFKNNSFVFLIVESEVNLDEINDFTHIRSIIKRAWKWYKSQVYIEEYTSEEKPGDFETERYLLKPSSDAGWWVCADKEAKIVIKWKEHLFNYTQEATELEDLQLSVTEIARVLREMTEWLRESHYNKIF